MILNQYPGRSHQLERRLAFALGREGDLASSSVWYIRRALGHELVEEVRVAWTEPSGGMILEKSSNFTLLISCTRFHKVALHRPQEGGFIDSLLPSEASTM